MHLAYRGSSRGLLVFTDWHYLCQISFVQNFPLHSVQTAKLKKFLTNRLLVITLPSFHYFHYTRTNSSDKLFERPFRMLSQLAQTIDNIDYDMKEWNNGGLPPLSSTIKNNTGFHQVSGLWQCRFKETSNDRKVRKRAKGWKIEKPVLWIVEMICE